MTRRRAEIGVRMALGASPGGVVVLVLRRVAVLITIGTVAGATVSLWASRFASPLLFGLDGRMMFGTFVAGNFFQVLGVHAAMGRALTPADDEPFAGQPVIVLSHHGWDRLFAHDPAVLGRRVLVNGVTIEIVGVITMFSRPTFRWSRCGSPRCRQLGND